MSQTIFSILEKLLLLVAGFFLGVLANLVTPKFQNWWAALSLKRLSKRIETLKIVAEEMKLMEPISMVDSEILRAVERIQRYVLVTLVVVIFIMYEGLWALNKLAPTTRPFSWSHWIYFFILAGIVVIILFILEAIVFGKATSSFFRSEETTWRLLYDIKELEAKLEKWNIKR